MALFGNNNPLAGKQKFQRSYNLTDFGVTADVVCQPGQWNKVGEVTVPAQQYNRFGANDATGGASIAGSAVYLKFDDSSDNQINGLVRFKVTNANETRSDTVMEKRTEQLSASQYDRTQAVLLPEHPATAGEDSKLVIEFYPDGASAVTIDYDGTDTDAIIPVTVYQ